MPANAYLNAQWKADSEIMQEAELAIGVENECGLQQIVFVNLYHDEVLKR